MLRTNQMRTISKVSEFVTKPGLKITNHEKKAMNCTR